MFLRSFFVSVSSIACSASLRAPASAMMLSCGRSACGVCCILPPGKKKATREGALRSNAISSVGGKYTKNDAGSFLQAVFCCGCNSSGLLRVGEGCGSLIAGCFLPRAAVRRPFFAVGAYKTVDFRWLICPLWLFAGNVPLLLGPILGRGHIRAGLNRILYAPATTMAIVWRMIFCRGAYKWAGDSCIICPARFLHAKKAFNLYVFCLRGRIRKPPSPNLYAPAAV